MVKLVFGEALHHVGFVDETENLLQFALHAHLLHEASSRRGFETLAVAWVENAAMTAIGNDLPEGCTTVGSLINTTHIKPSKLGAKVRATAVLKEIDGRKLTFNITAEDGNGIIGEGEHVRFIVDIERFMSKLR